MKKYESPHERYLWATYFGISLVIIFNIIPLFLFWNNNSNTSGLQIILGLSTIVIRIIAAVSVYDIAKRQNRNKVMWCILAAVSPAIILIIIGLLKRKEIVLTPKSNVSEPIFEKAPNLIEYKLEINRACNSEGLVGFVNKKGDILIPYQFSGAEEFSEGLAAVYYKGSPFDKYGFIDFNGKMVIPAIFDYADSFSEGLAIVRKNNYYGFINMDGNLIIPAEFEDAYPFIEGLAVVKKNKFFGFINKEGKFLIDCILDNANNFNQGKAKIVLKRHTYFINSKGEEVDPPL